MKKQIIQARNAGATVMMSCVIVALLTEGTANAEGELYEFATHLGLEVLVETHIVS